MLERLQKILSARGIASRRKAEEYIRQGLVRVNGKPASIGQKADPEEDRIEVDGTVLEKRREMLYYVMNKPARVITSNVGGPHPQLLPRARERGEAPFTRACQNGWAGRAGEKGVGDRGPTVRDLLPPHLRGKIYPVGRLDKDSEGLLLLTNDGVLAYRLTHPKFDHEKEYEVETQGPITEGALEKLRRGMMLGGERTKPAEVLKTGPRAFRIALTEGKYRQIRRMVQKVGNEVSRLRRVRILTLRDAKLKPGQTRPLRPFEVLALLRAAGIECPPFSHR